MRNSMSLYWYVSCKIGATRALGYAHIYIYWAKNTPELYRGGRCPHTPTNHKSTSLKGNVVAPLRSISLHSIPLRFASTFAHFSPIYCYQGLYIHGFMHK